MNTTPPSNGNGEPRVEMTARGISGDFSRHLRFTLAKRAGTATERDRYMALALAVRDRITDRWMATQDALTQANVKNVHYLSLEFLIGRLLGSNILNLGIEAQCADAMEEFGFDWNTLRNYEPDAGLGNGGLGRLAACFLDSLSTLSMPAIGYGLRYNYGIFRQQIRDGQQVEEPDNWLADGYPWELVRPEYRCTVSFGGHVENPAPGEWRWDAGEQVVGTPYDLPVVGYGGAFVNTLRLWSATADNEFDLDNFNRGSYVEAVEKKVLAENLTKVLYPNDNVLEGKELRLRQQYFFVACSVHDILRRFRRANTDFRLLPEKTFIHLNETHPALVIPELMRLLMDVENLPWDDAWDVTRRCVGYTNHTVLPEALETWSLPLMRRLLPRHTQIIFEANARLLRQVAIRWPGDTERLTRMSVIDEHGDKRVRMAHLAIFGASAVNGVAEIHSEILKATLFKDFYEFEPDKFQNKTNGITPRRWLLKANPSLAGLITDHIGSRWVTDLDHLRDLEPFADDPAFQTRFREIRLANKTALAQVIRATVGLDVNPAALFDVHAKRLHEYKRQLLQILHIITLYDRLVRDPSADVPPRVFIFAAKAAPGYHMAKLIFRLIHGVADVVNAHPKIGKILKVVFLPDYRVSLAERIIPAADLSEQISLAGTEASGTGCMKLMLNGALTIGTLDGANVEMLREAGDENLFIFGLTADEVAARRPAYNPRELHDASPLLRRVTRLISGNLFCLMHPGLFDPIVNALLESDHYMIFADLPAFLDAQSAVETLWRDPSAWARKSILNIARSGKFSSDRTIVQYAKDIWHIEQFPMSNREVSTGI